MPAINLVQKPKTLSRYDVVGEQSEREALFVKHVALLNEDNRFTQMGDEVRVVHMGPPLEQEKAIKVHMAGHVPFTNDDIKEVSCWIDEITDEYNDRGVDPRKQYVIHPAYKDECDPNTGVRRYRRFSCAGFILAGHLEVDIELLQIDDESLPNVEWATIISAYPDAERRRQQLHKYGLEGDGPWKVVLPGYVLHALNRAEDQIRQKPYLANEGDEVFPR